MTLPSVTIVIPTRNRIASLRRCLEPVVPYIKEHVECEIVVSDDGDYSETVTALRNSFPEVRVVQGPRKGPAANRNHGAAQGSGELLIFLDDDCIPETELIASYQREAAANPEVGVFEGRVSALGKTTGFADAAPSNETGGNLWSCNFAARHDVFWTIGGFDERFPFAAMEDIDFRLRIGRHSATRFVPGARVWHGYETRPGWRIVKHHALSLLLYLNIHGLDAKQRGPRYFFIAAARVLLQRAGYQIKQRALKHPQHLLYQVWAQVVVGTITTFWKFRGRLSKVLFPACCANCRKLHDYIATDTKDMTPNQANLERGALHV